MPLALLKERELEMILPWRNALSVRKAMFNHSPIGLTDHRAWFARVQQDPTRQWYLFRDAQACPQAVLYFSELDDVQRNAFWGFYTKPFAPKGTGKKMLCEGIRLAFGDLDLRKLNGEVLADNDPSLHLHKKLGFTQEGRFREQHFDGFKWIDVIRFGMLACEWSEGFCTDNARRG
jgi:UDP-4-amino-4,6-dideoxy-N-acetyl-beta-L-altrosamine N-acetyltransferase